MSKINFKNGLGIKGFYTFAKRTPDGDIPLFDGKPSNNIIVDAWLNHFRSYVNSSSIGSVQTGDTTGSIFARCAVGTSAAEPNFNNTTLGNEISRIGGTQQISNSLIEETIDGIACLKWTNSKTFVFPIGGVVGNISEVGIFGSTILSPINYLLFSRTLIKDSQGNNSTITLTAEDQLIVTYTLETIVPRFFNFNLTYGGENYLVEAATHTLSTDQVTPFIASVGAMNWADGGGTACGWRSTDFNFVSSGITNNNGGGWSSFPTGFYPSFVTPLNPANVRKRRLRIPTLAANSPDGIKGLRSTLGNSTGVTLKFTPAFPKTQNDILEIEFATDFVRM